MAAKQADRFLLDSVYQDKFNFSDTETVLDVAKLVIVIRRLLCELYTTLFQFLVLIPRNNYYITRRIPMPFWLRVPPASVTSVANFFSKIACFFPLKAKFIQIHEFFRKDG